MKLFILPLKIIMPALGVFIITSTSKAQIKNYGVVEYLDVSTTPNTIYLSDPIDITQYVNKFKNNPSDRDRILGIRAGLIKLFKLKLYSQQNVTAKEKSESCNCYWDDYFNYYSDGLTEDQKYKFQIGKKDTKYYWTFEDVQAKRREIIWQRTVNEKDSYGTIYNLIYIH